MEVELERRPKKEFYKREVVSNKEKLQNKMTVLQKEKESKKKITLEKIKATFAKQRENQVKWKKENLLEKYKNGTIYHDISELHMMIKQSSKERLLLERHLARATETAQKRSEVDLGQYLALQKTNQILRERLEQLEKIVSEKENADKRVAETEADLNKLKHELKERQQICANLKKQLNKVLDEKSHLEEYNSDLQQQVLELQPIVDDCNLLQETLTRVESNYKIAKSEVDSLQGKVNNLEALVQHLHEAAEKRKELEKQHTDALNELKKQQDNVKLSSTESEKQQALETVKSLESKVRELHKKCELQNVQHEELVLEMATLQRAQIKHAWQTQRCHSAETPGEKRSHVEQNIDMILPTSDTLFTSTQLPLFSSIGGSLCSSLGSTSEVYSKFNDINSLVTQSISSTIARITNTSPTSAALFKTTSNEINNILARIEQDNRMLLELEKSRTTVGSPIPPANITRLKSQVREDSSTQTEEVSQSKTIKPSATIKELDKLMEKLEQDNKILAELDKKRANIGSSSAILSSLPEIGSFKKTKERESLEEFLDDNSVDTIYLPGKGHCKIYIARYTYDPLKQSPNENPEAELHLNSGDFLVVYGKMDEDGFFNGELLDGKKGLVPSNFVERLTGEDLLDFQAALLYGTVGEDNSLSYIFDRDVENNSRYVLLPEDFHRMNDYIDLEDIEELDEDDLSDFEGEGSVPPPHRLLLERQLNKSIMISWLPPESSTGSISVYHVYVDGVLKASVKATEKTRALIEGVDSSQPHRISVRSVNSFGKCSRDAACTIVIGRDVPLAPSCVKVSGVTSTSAIISWLPSNSNFQHVITVNSVEVKAVKSGIFKHTITGLAPNTQYLVSVRTKPSRLVYNDEKNPKKLEMLTSYVEFRTLPKGLPDPPVDIQVEAGPQDCMLLVTWLPVTINPNGTSNGAPVTGYAVFVGGKMVTEVDSPTGDHAILDISQIASLKKKVVTVRTKSGTNLSTDSMPCLIPDNLLKNVYGDQKQFTSNKWTNVSSNTYPVRSDWRENSHAIYNGKNIDNYERDEHVNRISDTQHYLSSNKDHYSNRTVPSIEITQDKNLMKRTMQSDYNKKLDAGHYSDSRGSNYYSLQGRAASPTPPLRRLPPPGQEEEYYRQKGLMPSSYYNKWKQDGDIRNSDIRLFVGLFDYNPLTMSPNPDAASEELPFQEGQLIKVYGERDSDGFYKGEINGRIGYVPCNLVSEVQLEDKDIAQHLLNPDSIHSTDIHENRSDPWAHLAVRKMVALYDYDPQELSPNVDAEIELAFNTGDIIFIYGEMDEDGFYMGELNGVRGLVPSNFLAETPSHYLDKTMIAPDEGNVSPTKGQRWSTQQIMFLRIVTSQFRERER
ncbi:RIMS-binding protein 2-like isoform X3 [Centruroides vittatus]|uniref:RIMS-binding protein 2-like isoform X3 n=1 Tax=Centruroides vittatus TaxID=120091 RepID=UPI0035103F32